MVSVTFDKQTSPAVFVSAKFNVGLTATLLYQNTTKQHSYS